MIRNTLVVLKASALTFLVSALSPVLANSEDVSLRLKDLYTGQKTQLINAASPINIVMLYQPGCKWCKKQGGEMSALLKHCSTQAHLALVGADAKTKKLKRELRYFDQALPAYEANARLLRKIKGVEAFPTTLVFDSKGNLMTKQRGYVLKDKLKRVIELASQRKCKV